MKKEKTMELIVEKGEFERVLQKIQGVSEKRHAIPVLSHFLMSARNGTIRVTATDLDIILKGSCSADVKKDGEYLVPTRKMLDIIKVLPTETVSIELMENGYLSIQSGKSCFRIAGLPAKEFPDLPGKEDGVEFSIQAAEMKVMIDRVIQFVASEDSRVETTGVYCEKVSREGEEKIRLVGTDGHRLAFVEEKCEQIPDRLTEGIIIPRKGILEVRKLLDGEGGDVLFSVGKSFISTERDNFEITIRLIGGEFPAYREVIPSSFTRTVTVDRDRFIEVLRRVSVIASEKLKTVLFTIKENEVEVTSTSPDYGEGNDMFDGEVEGDEIKVGFNARYLLDVAASSGGEKLIMKIVNEMSPVLFQPGERDDFKAVVMPIRTTI